MKKDIFILILVLIGIPVFGTGKQQQKDTLQVEYRTEKSIPYRDAVKEKLNEYAIQNCQLDFYYPVNKKAFATVVWMHGGGLTGGRKEIPEILMKRGFAVIGIAYRLSPQVKCKIIIEDAAAAVAWAFRNVASYGGDTTQIYLSGHSAGGYLDLMVSMDKKWLAPYHIDPNRIAGILPLSPQTITHFEIRKERGIRDTQPVVDEYAPLFHVRADLPPLVLIIGDRELEMLGRYEENAYLARMMKLNGHKQTSLYELQGFNHVTMLQPGLYLLVEQLKELIRSKR